MGKKNQTLFISMVILALMPIGLVLGDEEATCRDVSGKGWAFLAGSGEMEFKGMAAIVIIGEQPKIASHGNGTVRRISQGLSVYRGNGKIEIHGEKLAIYIRGSGNLEACGKGFSKWGGSGLV